MNIVYTIPEFHGGDGLDLNKLLFAGRGIRRGEQAEFEIWSREDKRPKVFISLGSLNTDYPDFYTSCIEAFRDGKYVVAMTVGGKCDLGRLGDIPKNFYVNNYLPQLSILASADVFVTHAGFGSVNEALLFGVPMLALPIVNDQHMVAKRIFALGLGETAKIDELTPASLREYVDRLHESKTIKTNCENMAAKYSARDYLSEAADKLEKELCKHD